MKLGEILVRKGLISSTQVEQAITVQKICLLFKIRRTVSKRRLDSNY